MTALSARVNFRQSGGLIHHPHIAVIEFNSRGRYTFGTDVTRRPALSCVRYGCRKQKKDTRGSQFSYNSFFSFSYFSFQAELSPALWRICSRPIAVALKLPHDDKPNKEWKLNMGASTSLILQ
jgi:hypothetical protein